MVGVDLWSKTTGIQEIEYRVNQVPFEMGRVLLVFRVVRSFLNGVMGLAIC